MEEPYRVEDNPELINYLLQGEPMDSETIVGQLDLFLKENEEIIEKNKELQEENEKLNLNYKQLYNIYMILDGEFKSLNDNYKRLKVLVNEKNDYNKILVDQIKEQDKTIIEHEKTIARLMLIS